MEYKGRSVLYLETEASAISFCDRSYATWMSDINVKGYIVNWQRATTTEGEPVSEIEPIKDIAEQREISQLLQAKHGTVATNFS